MSDYVAYDPQLSVGAMQAVLWVETGVAILFVMMRAVLRYQGREHLTLDDALVVFALSCMITSTALYTPVISAIFLLSDVETGRVRRPQAEFVATERRFLTNQFAIIILFWTTIWSIKASFLVFYKKMFSGKFVGWQRIAWYVVASLCVATWVSNVVLQFFACSPFRTYFVIGACNDSRDVSVSNDSLYYATASDIFTDLLIMTLPLSVIWGLQMNKRTKAALGVLFLTGFIIILFAILRLVFTVPRHAHVNPKWLAVWSTTESCIAIAISCALPLRRFFVARSRHQSGNNGGSCSNKSSQNPKAGSLDRSKFDIEKAAASEASSTTC